MYILLPQYWYTMIIPTWLSFCDIFCDYKLIVSLVWVCWCVCVFVRIRTCSPVMSGRSVKVCKHVSFLYMLSSGKKLLAKSVFACCCLAAVVHWLVCAGQFPGQRRHPVWLTAANHLAKYGATHFVSIALRASLWLTPRNSDMNFLARMLVCVYVCVCSPPTQSW